MKKIILTISILFLMMSLIFTNVEATQIVIGNDTNSSSNTNSSTNNTSNSTGNNEISNKNSNSNSTNTNKVNNTVNKTNNTAKNSSYTNTNLPDTGSEDFVYGFIIIAGLASAIYAYIKIKIYNI